MPLIAAPAWLSTVLKNANIIAKDAQLLIQVAGDLTGTPITSPSAPVAAGSTQTPAGGESTLQEIGALVPKLPTDPITAGIDAGAVAIGVVGDVIQAVDSPQMQQGRLNVELQKIITQNALDEAQAQKTGDSTKVDENLSP